MVKDVVGYEGLYTIDENGKIYGIKRKKFLRTRIDGTGYATVRLCKNGTDTTHMVHRLIAEAFIPNPNHLPFINHKDEVKTNNNIDNLEWCDHKYNCNYGTRNERISKSNTGKPKTEAHRRHISEGRTGIIFSTEHRKHISEAKRRQYENKVRNSNSTSSEKKQ